MNNTAVSVNPTDTTYQSVHQQLATNTTSSQTTFVYALKMPTKIVDVKSYSSAAWWIKTPSATRRRKQRKHSYTGACYQDAEVVDLFRNISVHGYNKLFLPEFSIWEKLIWLVVHTTTLFVLLALLSLIWEQFVAEKVADKLHDPLYPIENVPFPAVSICSNNRISRQAAEKYAKELQSFDPENHNLQYFIDNIHSFSNMYFKFGINTFTLTDANFQAFLDTYSTLDNETFFNTRRIMKMLTPKCSELLLNCRLGGEEINCMGKTAFQESFTSYGPCCTFNLDNTYRNRTRNKSFVNPNLGLSVVLNTSQEDTFSTILNSLGTMLIIHSSTDFPDTASGACQIVYPAYGEESDISLRPRVIDTDDDLLSFSPSTRNCYFDREASISMPYSNYLYSLSNCITTCRISSILAVCNCLPFYMPMEMVTEKEGVIYCTKTHISCLLRYVFKFRNVITQRVNVPGLEREMEEGLFCSKCLPSCDDVQYKVSLISTPLSGVSTSMFLDNNNTQVDLTVSILHIHFAELHSQYFVRVSVNQWFDSFSAVGNFLSIFIGFSLVAICEILFYICKYFMMSIKLFVKQLKKEKNQKNGSESSFDEDKLYICP